MSLFDTFARSCLHDILTDIQTQNQNSKMDAKCDRDGLHPQVWARGSDIRHSFRFYYFNSKLHNKHTVFQAIIWCCERRMKTSNSCVKDTVMIYNINTLCDENRLWLHTTHFILKVLQHLLLRNSSKYWQHNKWVSKYGSQYELNNSSHAQALGIQTCLTGGKMVGQKPKGSLFFFFFLLHSLNKSKRRLMIPGYQ